MVCSTTIHNFVKSVYFVTRRSDYLGFYHNIIGIASKVPISGYSQIILFVYQFHYKYTALNLNPKSQIFEIKEMETLNAITLLVRSLSMMFLFACWMRRLLGLLVHY